MKYTDQPYVDADDAGRASLEEKEVPQTREEFEAQVDKVLSVKRLVFNEKLNASF
jgi:hypothetical protein